MALNRYQRQMILPEIGELGQSKLAAASVLCIGAGGLGSPALLYLAAAGVGKIGIADFDKVDESNLQRQILYTTQDVGKNKAETAKLRLQSLNPDIRLEVFPESLGKDNIESSIKNYDLIVDGTDNFSTKFLINDAVIKNRKTLVYGAIQGFDGQVSIFGAEHGPCYRCLYPSPPKASVQSCAEAGVIGSVAGLVGVTQALQSIQLIVGHESFSPLIGKLWTIDTRTMETSLRTLHKNPLCPVCSLPPERIRLEVLSPNCTLIHEVTVQQAKQMKNAFFIDVREQEEWDLGHIEGASHLPLSSLILSDEVPVGIPRDNATILYCRSGARSLRAAQILQAKGCVNLYNLTGGYIAWQDEE